MNLLNTYPNIANEWHPSLNAISPLDVTPHSHKKVWWICEHGHEWESVINNRTSNGNCCPYCSGRLPTETTSLGFLRPDLVKQWHPTKNKVTPFDVTQFTHKSVWWKCEHGHEWKSDVANRTNMHSGCPYCAGNLHTPETCLAAAFPDVAKEWHPTKNDRTPQEVTKSGAYRAWWQCSICSHEWQATVNNRTNMGSSCPNCCVGLQSSAPEIRLWSEIVHVFGKENVKHRWRDLGFEIDVYIPALRAGIEYDGFTWHKDKIAQDNAKYEKIKSHNIFLIRVTEIPEALADKVFISSKMPFHLVQRIIRCLRDHDSNRLFSDYISHYLNAITFQNSDLFKMTYDNMRKRTLGLGCELKYFECDF